VNGRIGNVINIKRFTLEGYFTNNSASPLGDLVRVLLVVDKQPDGATPSVGTVLDNSASLGSYYGPINIIYRSRFTVLMDRRIQFTVPQAPYWVWLSVSQDSLREELEESAVGALRRYGGHHCGYGQVTQIFALVISATAGNVNCLFNGFVEYEDN